MALTDTPAKASDEGAAVAADDDTSRSAPTAIEQIVGTGDHRTIGRLFIGLSLLFVTADLVLAALVNFNVASRGDLLGDAVGVRMAMNNPLALLLCGAMPLILGLAIHLVPMQVGSPAIAFPRAAAASLWTWLLGTVLFSVAMTVNGSYGGSNLKMARLGPVAVGLICVALLVGAVCVMVTVVSLRPAGMTLARVPHFSFSMLVAGFLWLVTLPSVIASIVLFHIHHPGAEEIAARAFPALEWMFRQPSLYIVAIPVLGIVADVAPGIARSRIKMYGAVQGMIGLFGLLAFGAWAQGSTQQSTLIWAAFAVGAGLPVLGVLGMSLDAVRLGSPKPRAALAGAVLAPLVLLLAAATGLLAAIDTLGKGQLVGFTVGGFDAAGGGPAGPGLVMGQFYFVIAAVVIASITACWYWGARLVDGGFAEGVGKLVVPLAFLGGALFGGGHLLLALVRPSADDSRVFAGVAGAGGVVLALAAVATLGVLLQRLVSPSAAATDGGGATLEWAAAELDLGSIVVESPYPLLDQKGAE